MVFSAVAAVCSYSYNEIKDAEEEAAELDALVAPLFDPKNQTEAASLPVIPKYWINVDGDWYYMAHNGINLWMLANTYVPKEHWPLWMDAAGQVRDVFGVASNTWFMWKDQDPEAVYVLRDEAKKTEPWRVGKTDTMKVWPWGGGIRTVSFPMEAYVSLPDAFPVKMPDVAVKRAMELGAISYGAPTGVKPFDMDYVESRTGHRGEQQEKGTVTKDESSGVNTVLWVLGILGVSVAGYLAFKDK